MSENAPAHIDADDIYQEMQIVLLKCKQAGKKSVPFMRFRIIDFLRKEGGDSRYLVNKRTLELYDFDPPTKDHSPPKMVDFDIIVGTLPEKYQKMFRMKYVDGLTYADIGRVYGMTKAAVAMAFHHQIEKLRLIFKHLEVM